MKKETKVNKHGSKDNIVPVSAEYGFVTFHYNDDELGDRIEPVWFLP